MGSPLFLAPEVIKGKQSKEADMWAIGVTIYMLVSGYAPIQAENKNKIFDKIVEGKWDFNLPAFRKVSSECKDLIKRLLCVEPSERITINEVMQHEWFELSNSPQKPR